MEEPRYTWHPTSDTGPGRQACECDQAQHPAPIKWERSVEALGANQCKVLRGKRFQSTTAAMKQIMPYVRLWMATIRKPHVCMHDLRTIPLKWNVELSWAPLRA